MISRAQAERIARSYLASDEGKRYFKPQEGGRARLAAMQQCTLGWSIVVREGKQGTMNYGEALHVIDRENGSILRFPPAMPPPMLLEDLARYRSRASVLSWRSEAAPPEIGEVRK